jgi:hypothetical protein
MLRKQTQIAQEFGIYDDNMPISTLMFMSSKVEDIWQVKAQCVETGKIYIGG